MFRPNPFPRARVPDASPGLDFMPARGGPIFAECRL